jgi:hypothetical protein
MIHSQTYRPQGKKILGRAAPVLALLLAFSALCLILPSLASAFGANTSSPQLGQPPAPNAGWQADQVDREAAWWKSGRPGGGQGTPAANPPQGPWAPWSSPAGR